ncbi:TetR/AcrR family transcriptional regulator [Umezawaea endophytica]|uniref:TetR/AcrR family transcriptional regulator n=1 Tax=Umezawaea endophytica TaxID=1654476 RepID=A0A9X3AFY3_9PSEU|nr:TetR/AcrR family transcriptional regulator [Umezawaea endophytica]MCS7477765.1 TetR/AcrR family transcriptional regulator [Umezawaea endophytica]
MAEQEPTRRERIRRRTVAEIKAAAMDQVRESGSESLSLNAIARTMAMSMAALYRYFDSRDALLADLAVDVHLDLAEALEAAAGRPASPVARVRAVANAYREWALAHPHAYRLAHGSTHGSGRDHAGDRIVPAAQRSMAVLLAVVAEVGRPSGPPVPAGLERQILRWNSGGHHDLPVDVLRFGLVWWSRLHGLISLELGEHLAATGIDPALLYEGEVDAMLAGVGHRYGATA